MHDNTRRDTLDIEKQIYQTQWANIRHHWDQTVAGIRYLSTLIALAVIPLKFLHVDEGADAGSALDSSTAVYAKVFVLMVILVMGLVTFLNQWNHYGRSREARKVVVAIEHRWNLYDDRDRFIFQGEDTDYAYGKFAGGERRLTHAKIQFAYIVVITVAATLLVIFA